MMRRIPVALVLLGLLGAVPAFAQQGGGLIVQNPLDELLVALTATLTNAGEPFTEEQTRAIALVMDEQRRAAEDLFGQALDFSAGPPQGAELDRALAGIAWMTEAFLENLDAVLTPKQGEAWMHARLNGTVPQSNFLSLVEAQEQGRGLVTQNPLDEILAALTATLSDAGLHRRAIASYRPRHGRTEARHRGLVQTGSQLQCRPPPG